MGEVQQYAIQTKRKNFVVWSLLAVRESVESFGNKESPKHNEHLIYEDGNKQ